MFRERIKGDLVQLALNAKAENKPFIMAHGCNCFGAMFSGIARQISHEFPEANSADLEALEKNGSHNLAGKYSYVKSGSVEIFNLYTQFYPGRNYDYGLIRQAFIRLNALMAMREVKPTVFIPMIGAGIAGGDWELIRKIIKEESSHMIVEVVIYDR
ncbi:MAG: macro domain-containing protein [Cetobacterium sp.]|uniref:macro domain-containing protein n=1 Tax=Cetobacterium sp. TaxID=2071632 RepID=UPI003EE792F2